MSETIPYLPATLHEPAPVSAELSRSALRKDEAARSKRSWLRGSHTPDDSTPWRYWLGFSVALGALLGVAWWLLAPGGAFYGDGEDFAVWFPRDAVLATLLVVGGILSTTWLLRQQRATARGPVPVAAAAAMLVGGLVGSVIAWRMGVFAGDLFHTPANNLPHPSMVFSLRSQTVLIVWPLASVVTLFLAQVGSYAFFPATPPPVRDAPERPRRGERARSHIVK
ncbi:hypothetical protein ACX80E_05110 [Arthrobacter sp. TMN-49]